MQNSSETLLTIVIPVYNREKLIGRCLDSALAQTLRPLDVIVVDNGSTDSTPDAVRKWCHDAGLSSCSRGLVAEKDKKGGNGAEVESWVKSGFRITLTFEERKGASAARNRGLEMTLTPYVSFFDSDDEMLPSLGVAAVEALADADIVLWKAMLVSSSGNDPKKERRGKVKKYREKSMLRNQMIHSILSTQTFAVRTEWIRQCGGWNEDAMAWNDWEVGIRLLRTSRIAFVPEVMALIYPQKESITGTGFASKAGVWENTLDIVERRLYREMASSENRRLLRLISYRRMILAAHYTREGRSDLGKKLLAEAMAGSHIGAWRRALLRILYGWTAIGGRGASILWP